jgi:hypothetical protein
MEMLFKSDNIVLFVSPKRTKKHSEILILLFGLTPIYQSNPKNFAFQLR